MYVIKYIFTYKYYAHTTFHTLPNVNGNINDKKLNFQGHFFKDTSLQPWALKI